MRIRYLVNDDLIPKDGSHEIIKGFGENVRVMDAETLIYPDVHYKKGARSVNGMLISSKEHIFPALLGVANCGFTFGQLKGINISNKSQLLKAYASYAKYAGPKSISLDEIRNKLASHIKEDIKKSKNNIWHFCGIKKNSDIIKTIDSICTPSILNSISTSLGNLGGGNHFFEVHRVDKVYESINKLKEEDLIFILHSDSINAGNLINLLFSNLSEMGYLKGLKGLKARLRMRLSQLYYYTIFSNLLFTNTIDTLRLLFSNNDFRSINANTKLGKKLLLAFGIASAVGEMNRMQILDDFIESCQKVGLMTSLDVFGSHSHDSISIEKYGKTTKVVQRNGVQKIANSPCYVLPGALGTESFLFLNPKNKDAYYSANHGTGRLLDKHLAKVEFSKSDTETYLKNKDTQLFRVGSGNLSEQHPNAFKNVESIAKVMENYNLGKKAIRLEPIMVLKG